MHEFWQNVVHIVLEKLPESLVGLMVGLIAVMLIRGRQIWRDRQYYGYTVYKADYIQRWLYRLARCAGLLVILGSVAYWWLKASSVPRPVALVMATQAPPSLTTPDRLVIPRVGVNALLIDVPITDWQWDITRLTTEVGHLEGTPEPGGPGNAVVAGHVTDLAGIPGPFWELASIQLGDYVYLEQGSDIFKYEVAEIRRVDPEDVGTLYQTSYETQLTLLTCDAFDAATETYQKRLIVIARRVNS